jgi:hypothetical protein
MRALVIAMMLAGTVHAEPLQLLWDTDYGPWLLDPDVAVVVVNVERVTRGAANRDGDFPSVLRARVERVLRGPPTTTLELKFVKQAHYKTPIDKSRAFHDQWQELAFAKDDALVFLLRGGVPLAVVVGSDSIVHLAAVLDDKRTLEARVGDAMLDDHFIVETFARAALNDKRALPRDAKARVLAGVLAAKGLANDRKQTWALYTQGVFDAKQGADAANVDVIRGLLTAAVAGDGFEDLLEQFLVRDFSDGKLRDERKKLLSALDKKLLATARSSFQQRPKYRALASVL